MATKSGMNYDKVESLIEYLNNKKTEIINGLDDLRTTEPAQIAQHYSGEAAETYKETLDTTVNTISETLEAMINSLRTAASEKQADYASQDQKMQESVSQSI
jgi:uncharacterized protein YukE